MCGIYATPEEICRLKGLDNLAFQSAGVQHAASILGLNVYRDVVLENQVYENRRTGKTTR